VILRLASKRFITARVSIFRPHMVVCLRNKLQGPPSKNRFRSVAGPVFSAKLTPDDLEESNVMNVMKKVNKPKNLYTPAIIAVIGAILMASPSVAAGPQAAPARRDTVANFKLQNLAGGFMTNEDLKGKVTVVDLFATWCGPCVGEIPKFNQLYEAYQGKDVAIIGIVVESPGNIASKVRQLGIKYPVLIGDNAVLSAFANVEAFPTTVVINKEGKVYKSYRGAVPNKQGIIKQDIERLLSEDSRATRPVS
jgi:thiol-disulfide isomerase/thioredoxin